MCWMCLHPSCIVLLFFQLGGFENAQCVGGACPPLVCSHLFAGIGGSLRLCDMLGVLAPLLRCLFFFFNLGASRTHGVLGVLAPLSHVLIYLLELMAARGFAVCWVCLHSSHIVSCFLRWPGDLKGMWCIGGTYSPLMRSRLLGRVSTSNSEAQGSGDRTVAWHRSYIPSTYFMCCVYSC